MLRLLLATWLISCAHNAEVPAVDPEPVTAPVDGGTPTSITDDVALVLSN